MCGLIGILVRCSVLFKVEARHSEVVHVTVLPFKLISSLT